MEQEQNYNDWRSSEIHRVGLKTQLMAEAHLEKHEKLVDVEVLNHKSGTVEKYNPLVADRLVNRGDCSYRKSYYSVPYFAFFDKSRVEV